jgi:AraC-like DNA-binding protein
MNAVLGRRSPSIVHGELFRRLIDARDLIEDDYAEPLALDTLAQASGLSPFHFLREFRRAFGATPHAYLTRVRLARARELLARGEANVTDACFEVGYSSLGSFSALFTREVGCSPSEYRRRMRRLVPVPAQIGRLYVPCRFAAFWCRA